MIQQRATLYADKAHIPPEIFAVRNDTGRELVAEIADYTIPSGAAAEIRATLPDGTTATAAGTIDGQTVTAPLDDLLTAEGKAAAQIRITNGGQTVTTFAFFVDVTEDLAGDTEEATAGPAEVVTFETDAALPLTSLVVEIEPQQSGSGTPSPDNVRPITGTESVTVARVGKNLLPRTASGTQTRNGVTFTVNDDGSVTMNGTATVDMNFAYSVDAPVRLDGDYIISGINGGSGSTWRFRYATKDASGTQSPWVYVNSDEQARTITGAESIFRFVILIANGTTLDNVTVYPMIRRADDPDPTYQPYTGETVTTDLGRTVYGGTVDLVTGELTVTHGIVDLGTLTWQTRYTGSTNKTLSALPPYLYNKRTGLEAICDKYPIVEQVGSVAALNEPDSKTVGIYGYIHPTAQADPQFYMVLPIGDTPSGNICYKLATPQTYQLTPAQILALLGGNTIWSDAGQVTVKYRREAEG